MAEPTPPAAPGASAGGSRTASPAASALTEAQILKRLGPTKSECVKVCIRIRPLIHAAELQDRRLCVEADCEEASIGITNPEDTQRFNSFTFDAIFAMDSTQTGVYDQTARPIIESVLEGYNGTVIAYGQTGAGKTFTMEGNAEFPGLIPQCFHHIFDAVKQESQQKKFLVQCSMLQIYKEEVFDLLSRTPKNVLKLRENPKTKEFYVPGLTTFMVVSAEQIHKIMRKGQSNRAVHSTPMNPGSSRSHCIFQVKIETVEQYADTPDTEPLVRSGKLQLVDLAGSERAKKTGGVRQAEMIKINWGLTCLGNVIMALTQPPTRGGQKVYIPYRNSRLTKLLQDSLGGNTKTVLIANVSPSWYNYSETLGTLRYAARAKRIQNKPKVNEDPKDALIRQFQAEIEALKGQLMGGVATPGGGSGGGGIGGAAAAMMGLRMDEGKLQAMREEMEAEKARLVAEMRDKTEAERQALLQQQEELEARKTQVEQQLEERAEEVQRAKQVQANMKQKLKRLQTAVMEGGSLRRENQEIRAEIRAHKQQLLAAEVEQVELKRTLAEQREQEEVVHSELQSTKGEVRIQSKKLQTLWRRYKAAKAEIQDLQNSFAQEKEELIFTIRALQRDLRLKDLIIENFIPKDHVRKIANRAIYDEDAEEFSLRGVQLAGNRIAVTRGQSALGLDRPVARFAMSQQDPRYKTRDILDYDSGVGLDLQVVDGSDSEDEDMYYY